MLSSTSLVSYLLGRCQKRGTILAVLLVAALLFIPSTAVAQSASGSISGTVTDASGAIVPKAKVVLTNEATKATTETVSNNSGIFYFEAVLPATYTVTISASGFNNFEARGITMTQGARLVVPNIVLQVSGTKIAVQVEAIAETLVPTDSPQSSQTLTRNMIEELSIVGRDAAELIKIMPGMGIASGGLGQGMWNSYTTQSNNGPIEHFTFGGTQPNGAMTMTSDGANLLDPGNQGTQTANINQNQIQEVSILTSAYGAEFAKGPVTFQAYGKSGGAQFHGGAYLYARNGVFNSVDSFTKNQGGVGLVDSFYYPGGDLGGPVLIPKTGFNKNRDKLFFYTAYEYMHQQPNGALHNYFIPTSQMLNATSGPCAGGGDFSPAYLQSLGSGFANARSIAATSLGGNRSSQDGVTYPGGCIPHSAMDPNSLIYQKLFPAPNADPTKNSTGSNYEYFEGPPTNRFEWRIRGDWNISEKTKIYFSYNMQREGDQSPIGIWWEFPGALPYPSGEAATQKSDIYSANMVHVFSPTLTNEFVYSQARFLNPIILANPDAVDPSKLGFQFTGLFKNALDPQIPNTWGWNNSFAGFDSYPFGPEWTPGGAHSFGKLSDTPNISDNLSKVWGTHTLKVGFYWDYALNNQVAGGGYNDSTQGGVEYDPWGAHSTGNAVADLILGLPSALSQQQNAPVANFKYYQYSFYVNDQWKATRRLSLTLGLRMDHMGNWVPASGPGLAVWDQALYNNTSSAPAWTGLQWNAINSKIPMSGFPSRAFFPEPRFGAAYDLFGNGKTVLRGGAGLYRYQLAYNSVSGSAYSAPLNIADEGTTWGCCVGWNQFNQYSPSLGTPGLGTAPAGMLTMGDDRTPYTWTYNFTISQRVPWRSVAEFQYSGNASRDMMLHGPLSQIDLIPLGAFFKADPITGVINNPASSGFPVQDYYPLHEYTGMQLVGHGSYSNYNAFIATWQKQTGRITFTTNYTFSKVLGVRDNESDNGPANGNTMWPYSMGANYGVLGWDHTHIFNAAYVFNMPSPIKGNRVLQGVVNGWVVSGITQWQSGVPIQNYTNGNLNASFPSSYQPQQFLGTTSVSAVEPILICDPRSGLASGQYFNPNCFAPPPPGMNGNIIWPYIKTPAFFNSDLAMYKNFNFKEHQKIQFRFSTFNFLNHPLQDLSLGGNSAVNLNFQDSNGNLVMKNLNALTNGYAHYTTGRRVVEFTAKYNF